MNNTAIILIIVIAIIAIVGFTLFQPISDVIPSGTEATDKNTFSTTQETRTIQAPKSENKINTNASPAVTKDGYYIVSYLNSGFSPHTLEIKRGQSVRFVNNSTRSMRIVTADTTNNPTYQALNQSKTVGKGGTYDFTFNEIGTYLYMNYNNSADRGTVMVK